MGARGSARQAHTGKGWQSDRKASVSEVSLKAGGFGQRACCAERSGRRVEADLSEGGEEGVDAHEQEAGAEQLDQF